MREEIEELVFHMADLKEAIKGAKHPWPLKVAYAKHKSHLRKLFKLQMLATDIKYANKSTFSAVPAQTHLQQSPPQIVGPEPADGSLVDDLVGVSVIDQTTSPHPLSPEDSDYFHI